MTKDQAIFDCLNCLTCSSGGALTTDALSFELDELVLKANVRAALIQYVVCLGMTEWLLNI